MDARSIDKFHQAIPGHRELGVVELLALACVLRFIDSGYLWLCAMVIILAFGGLVNLGKLVEKLFKHE